MSSPRWIQRQHGASTDCPTTADRLRFGSRSCPAVHWADSPPSSDLLVMLAAHPESPRTGHPSCPWSGIRGCSMFVRRQRQHLSQPFDDSNDLVPPSSLRRFNQEIGRFYDLVAPATNTDADPRLAQHLNVVESITDSDDFVGMRCGGGCSRPRFWTIWRFPEIGDESEPAVVRFGVQNDRGSCSSASSRATGSRTSRSRPVRRMRRRPSWWLFRRGRGFQRVDPASRSVVRTSRDSSTRRCRSRDRPRRNRDPGRTPERLPACHERPRLRRPPHGTARRCESRSQRHRR